ncbi:hypothetical protein BDV96DRAFT_592033 [Lophiotrema nucula]|uniref:Uncharacterized protein n=1 Tax=Lophiotrema nucula TaxID=690887 RepID=A0A6A5YHS5_9PLEO|nr:hypothetical protein BDV96DRAFT_592033 [Lophiotrema nucula]
MVSFPIELEITLYDSLLQLQCLVYSDDLRVQFRHPCHGLDSRVVVLSMQQARQRQSFFIQGNSLRYPALI